MIEDKNRESADRSNSYRARYPKKYPHKVRDYGERMKGASVLTQEDKVMLQQWQTENPDGRRTKGVHAMLQKATT